MLAKDIMTKNVITLNSSVQIGEAIKTLIENEISGSIVVDEGDRNLMLSAKNIPDIKVIKTAGLNVYDILKYENLLLEENAIKAIEGRLT